MVFNLSADHSISGRPDSLQIEANSSILHGNLNVCIQAQAAIRLPNNLLNTPPLLLSAL